MGINKRLDNLERVINQPKPPVIPSDHELAERLSAEFENLRERDMLDPEACPFGSKERSLSILAGILLEG